MKKNGFTLIELVITLGILGILSAIGLPRYLGYADNARVNTVKNNLRSIYLQQQEYYQRNNAYYKTGSTCSDSTAAINTNLFNGKTIIVNDKFYYCITQTTVDDFTAKSVEISGSRNFTVNQNNQTSF